MIKKNKIIIKIKRKKKKERKINKYYKKIENNEFKYFLFNVYFTCYIIKLLQFSNSIKTAILFLIFYIINYSNSLNYKLIDLPIIS